MADWTKPTTASTYANYTAELDGRLKDLAYANDPAVTTLTSAPTNTVRWNSAQRRWEKFNGTSWAVLESNYAINVETANAWSTGRTISLTGDASGTSASWTGSANISVPVTLATVNSNTGSFGSASAVPVITVNAKGLITSVSTAALGSIATQASNNVTISGGSISGTAITLVQSTTASPTAEGRIEWDTDDDVLRIGTGAGTKTVVNTDNTQTLTNKTMGSGCSWGGTAVPVTNGGTGATNAATARTNLGLGSIATQNANSVAITGGSISGTAITLVQSTTAAPTAEGVIEWDTDDDLLVLGTASGTKIQVNTDTAQTLTNKTMGSGCSWGGTAVPVTNGGTGATNAATARTNLDVPSRTGSGASGSWNISVTGNAETATKLQTARAINGTSFDGSGNITTANWGTARTITIGNTGKSVNGSADVSWSLAEIGAAAATATVNLTGDQTIGGNKTFSTTNGLRAQGLILLRQDTSGEGGEISFQRASDATIHYYLDVIGTGTTPSFRLVNAARSARTWSVDNSGNMTAEGNVTAFSDIRLKTDLRPIPEALTKVKALTGYTYTRIDTGERQTGLVAQDVQRVLPEAVIEGEHLSLAYGNLVGLLVEAIKEQARQIEALTARVEKLEGC